MGISQKNYHATIGCTINTRATEKRREENRREENTYQPQAWLLKNNKGAEAPL
jgi:hypothetical protein